MPRCGVSNWSTSEQDIDRTVETIARAVHNAALVVSGWRSARNDPLR
jgi:hypothetical protein